MFATCRFLVSLHFYWYDFSLDSGMDIGNDTNIEVTVFALTINPWPYGGAGELWWDSQVVNYATMIQTKVSISILSLCN